MPLMRKLWYRIRDRAWMKMISNIYSACFSRERSEEAVVLGSISAGQISLQVDIQLDMLQTSKANSPEQISYSILRVPSMREAVAEVLPPTYRDFIKEAFIDPIRSAIVVDDEYPTLDELLLD